MHDARPSHFICAVLCAVLWNLSRTRRVRSRVMRDARPSLFIFAVLSAVLRSGFRDTDPERLTTRVMSRLGIQVNAHLTDLQFVVRLKTKATND